MENYFKKLSAINVKQMAEKKGKFNYLSWANAWSLLKENHPDANRTVYESEHTGLNYFTDGKTASVKVGITVWQDPEDIEHIDYLPIMDYRNNSIPLEKITSMDVNTAIQRSTAKAIAMHGLGISIFKGEDLVDIAKPPAPAPAKPVHITLDIGDLHWDKVLNYVAANKKLGLPKIVAQLETKYKLKAVVKKELSKHL
jgi:hypothetical protein|tara:strand:+ start:1278 stop:1871 length:594 start_codon:yes stop_codon:yes gene_type:complete